MINALSIDVEFWYSGEPYSNYLPNNIEDQIEQSIYPILDLLDCYKIHGTFFILGKLAEKYPYVVKQIFDRGHEISSHGYTHKRLCFHNKKSFEEEIILSKNIIESLTGLKPIGYRAPSFSMDNSTKWALKILEKHGFKYDSSVFPFKTRFYGVPTAPLGPYKPSMNDISRIDNDCDIVEFPISVIKIVKNVPFAGGYFFRMFPFIFIKSSIKKINNEQRPVLVYIHPWETYLKTPHVNIPFPNNFRTYYGINSALRKFEKLIKTFCFAPIREVLNL